MTPALSTINHWKFPEIYGNSIDKLAFSDLLLLCLCTVWQSEWSTQWTHKKHITTCFVWLLKSSYHIPCCSHSICREILKYFAELSTSTSVYSYAFVSCTIDRAIHISPCVLSSTIILYHFVARCYASKFVIDTHAHFTTINAEATWLYVIIYRLVRYLFLYCSQNF